jgi:hypothetical protein
MALKGNLRDFTITQLLNLVNLAQKTGSLVVEGPGESAVLHKAQIISNAQYSTLKARAQNMGDKELGLLLINSGYVSQEDIIASLQTHFVEIVQKLFTWVEGFFSFDGARIVPTDKIPVRMDLENIIMEGSRQLREWEELKDEIPNLDMALKFTDRPGVNLRNVNLSVEEWRVVSFINPKNTMNQIAQTAKISDLDIRRIVYGLLQAGLVEMVRPDGAKQVLPGLEKAIPGETKEAQKNLVNKIIGRIRSL